MTDAYSEVMDTFVKDDNNQTALDRYLASLSSKSYTVDNVYLTNTGKFTFELSETDGYHDFYEINYIKVEDTDNNVTRYAFIENITIVNGLAVVQYIEDTWANYSSSMVIRNSLLSRSRIIDYGQTIYGRIKIPYYTIDLPYESNEMPKLSTCAYDTVIGDDAVINNCNAIVSFQIYKTEQQGEISARRTYTTLLKCTINELTSSFDFKPGVWVNIIQEMIIQSSSLEIQSGWNYEISSVYLLPVELGISTKANTTEKFNLIIPASATTDMFDIKMYELYPYEVNYQNINDSGELVELTGYILPNDFKRIGVGTLSQMINVVNNGSDINVSVFYSADAYNFALYLGVQGQLIEITDSFRLDVPIASQTADVTQQQKTARAVETLNGTLQMVGGVVSMGFGGWSMGTSNALLTAGQSRGQLGGVVAGQHAVQGSTSGLVGGVGGFVRGLTNVVVANLPMFTTNKGLVAKSNAVLNAGYGIITATIVADNDTEVENYINEGGYVCEEIVDNKIFTDIQTGIENKYNVVMFDYVKLYGKFSQRTASVLREILTNGVKIWYDETSINE